MTENKIDAPSHYEWQEYQRKIKFYNKQREEL